MYMREEKNHIKTYEQRTSDLLPAKLPLMGTAMLRCKPIDQPGRSSVCYDLILFVFLFVPPAMIWYCMCCCFSLQLWGDAVCVVAFPSSCDLILYVLLFLLPAMAWYMCCFPSSSEGALQQGVQSNPGQTGRLHPWGTRLCQHEGAPLLCSFAIQQLLT